MNTDTGALKSLFGRTVAASFLFAPPALLLAFGLAWLAFMLWMLPGVLRLAPVLGPEFEGAFGIPLLLLSLALVHGVFIAAVAGFVAPVHRPQARRLADAARSIRRGALPLAAVFGAILGLLFVVPMAAPALWAVATLTAIPSRVGRNGWAGFARLGEPLPTPPLHRLATMAPSFLLLSAFTYLLSNAGDSWGLMDGAVVTVPLLGLTLFWGCFSAALLSAYFAAETA